MRNVRHVDTGDHQHRTVHERCGLPRIGRRLFSREADRGYHSQGEYGQRSTPQLRPHRPCPSSGASLAIRPRSPQRSSSSRAIGGIHSNLATLVIYSAVSAADFDPGIGGDRYIGIGGEGFDPGACDHRGNYPSSGRKARWVLSVPCTATLRLSFTLSSQVRRRSSRHSPSVVLQYFAPQRRTIAYWATASRDPRCSSMGSSPDAYSPGNGADTSRPRKR